MASASFRRKTLLLLLLVALATAPWASAAAQSRPAAISASAPFDLFSAGWRFLTSLWSKEGCRIDPDGRCMPQAAQPLPVPRTGEGCRIDPNGACLPRPANSVPTTDSGCHIDPSGLCRS
jgi:hypothetical protein